jgi:hypothetical protein
MKLTFEGYLFNRLEKIGNKNYNHVGCEGEHSEFGDFLTHFVPKIGMRRKVKFTIETQAESEIIKDYQIVDEGGIQDD